MALGTIQTSPKAEDFKPLSEHEEQTPGTFYGGKAVLHLYSANAKIRISKDDLEAQDALTSLASDVNSAEGEQVEIENIDVWVTSTSLTLWSSAKSIGTQIPYQTITVHAQEGSAVFFGLNLSDNNTADEDIVFIQLRIIPTSIEKHESSAPADAQTQQPNGHSTLSPAQALFKAISDCQELNPDPPEDGDGEFDETAPGATGWITSDNMQDFMDENGEFSMPAGATVVGADTEEDGSIELGEGAGRTRSAAEVEDADGNEDETKWQRTG